MSDNGATPSVPSAQREPEGATTTDTSTGSINPQDVTRTKRVNVPHLDSLDAAKMKRIKLKKDKQNALASAEGTAVNEASSGSSLLSNPQVTSGPSNLGGDVDALKGPEPNPTTSTSTLMPLTESLSSPRVPGIISSLQPPAAFDAVIAYLTSLPAETAKALKELEEVRRKITTDTLEVIERERMITVKADELQGARNAIETSDTELKERARHLAEVESRNKGIMEDLAQREEALLTREEELRVKEEAQKKVHEKSLKELRLAPAERQELVRLRLKDKHSTDYRALYEALNRSVTNLNTMLVEREVTIFDLTSQVTDLSGKIAEQDAEQSSS